ncbi:putative RNA-directed DNA polymerase, eukaryota, reverse transcriptase zinc-binding domain protein [Tanacetum coccineum]
MSSAEAEYVALSASCAQVMWMRTQLQDYGFNYNKIPLYCDSQSAIAISCNPLQHSHTKQYPYSVITHKNSYSGLQPAFQSEERMSSKRQLFLTTGHSGKTNVLSAEKISVLSCYFPVRYSNHIGEEISCHLWYASVEIPGKCVEHLKMEMEISCSNKIKFITACSFSNDTFEDIKKAQVSVIKASATLNIQAFKIKKSVSISFRMTQVHKMAKDHMRMIRDYDWMMISKKLKDHIQVKLKPKKIIGSTFNYSLANDFNQFLMEGNLYDLPLGGHAFTRISSDGEKLSRLDRFLISDNLAITFLNMHGTTMDRMISDHRAIILQHSDMDFGPIPFKFFNSWLLAPNFKDVIKNAWDNFQCKDNSNMQIMFKEKMNHLKNIIKDRLDALQKAKVKWGVEADENSKFFHGIVNRKRRQLAINGIMKEGTWITKLNDIKGVFLKFFQEKFSRFEGIKVLRRSESYNSLNVHQSSFLEEPVSEVEIKKSIWDCGSEKSPGPDGFTFAFYKRYWSTYKNDIIAYVRDFFDFGKIPSGCNSSFITLIPKVANPLVVLDFRPISLIGAQYKVIAKILANRLSQVIETIISSEQTAFVSQRHILDGPLMVNEIIDWYKRKKEKLMILKIDFEKAFDSISWDFLDQVLYPTIELNLQRGLRQGDPLSLFLFILVMEGLHVAIQDAINAGLYCGAKLHFLHVSHLLFADDVLLLGEWSSINISNVVNLLNCFYKVSSLKLNLHKSNLYGVGVDLTEVSNLALVTSCQAQCLPFSYMGLSVGSNMARINSWVPIIDKFKKRLSRWKSRLLSIGSRSTLITSVLGSLGSIEDAVKIPWIAWKSVIAPKSQGGLGIESVWARIVKSINSLNEKGIIPFSTLKRKVNDGTELNQDCLVSEKWNGDWIWSWSRPITSGTTKSHLEELQNLVSNVQLEEAIDEWQWNRRPQTAPVRRVEDMLVEGSRRRGRPKLRWKDRLKQDMKELLLSKDMTSDRNAWRDRIRISG